MNREGTMYGNGRGMRGNVPQGRMTQDGRGMRSGAPQGRRTQDGRGMADGYRQDMECECTASRSTESCACGPDLPDEPGYIPKIPAGSRMQLLTYIDEVSFCAYDLMLYLDTHPEDACAMEYFGKYSEARKRAADIYEEKYGPLQYGQSCGNNMESVKWVTEPWPWEGGDC
ncbi:MAG: spore coat protein CotJB [Clostridiales bacterium]|nr:spore coat protein CotJB [Clostridiales bacterium]